MPIIPNRGSEILDDATCNRAGDAAASTATAIEMPTRAEIGLRVNIAISFSG
jgi:hypothetical protein